METLDRRMSLMYSHGLNTSWYRMIIVIVQIMLMIKRRKGYTLIMETLLHLIMYNGKRERERVREREREEFNLFEVLIL